MSSPALPTRLSGMRAAQQRFGDKAQRIVPFFMAADPLADAAAAALQQLERAHAQALLERALRHGSDAVADAPAALVQLLRQAEQVPFWVDYERCRRGGEAFFRTGPLGGVALGFGALARAYCSAGGNKPLTFTRELVERAPQRLSETASFVRKVCEPDALRPGHAGFRAVLEVRLLHARVRLSLLAHPGWRSRDWGVPISQADTATTALLFSHGVAEGVRRLGGAVSHAEEADMLHLWRCAGHLLGVEDELLAATREEAAQLAQLIETMDAGPDEDSAKLLAAILSPKLFEAQARNRQTARLVRGYYVAACRALIGPANAAAAGLDGSAYDAWFRHLLRPLTRAVTHVAHALPSSQLLLEQIGQRYWSAFIELMPGTEPVRSVAHITANIALQPA
ncbi:MAG: hypothetical protein JWN48_5920 [Myxococcaceae bacterium]|nr:hypothetical protein [Myxococcaceae bacterium]